MPLSLLRFPGPKMGDLDWREQDVLRSLLGRARRGSSDPQEVLKEATGRLDRRVVDRLVDELPGGIEHLQDVQFRHRGLSDDFRAPAAGVVALAWLRAAETMLQGGMKPEALRIFVRLVTTRDEAKHAPSG